MTGEMRRTTNQTTAIFSAGLLAATLSVAVLLAARPAAAQGNEDAKIYASNLRGQYDIFSGKNNNGPYVLSWNNVVVNRDNRIEAVIDGRTLKAEEFTTDLPKGIINFAAPVSDKNVVRIHYSYDPQKSRRNAGIASSPITLPLVNLGVTQLKVIALPNNGGGSSATEAPLVFNLGNSRKLLGGNFTTNFNFAGTSSFGQQTDYVFGNDRNGFNANYYTAAKKFANSVGKSVGMGDAAVRWSLGTRLTPMKWLGTSFSHTDTNDTVNHIDRAQQIYAMRVGGMRGGPLLNFQRTEDDATDAQKNTTEINTDKLDLTARLTKSTNVVATGVQTITDAPNVTGDAAVRDATVTVTSAGANGSSGSVALNVGGKDTQTSQEEKQNVALKIQPAPAFGVSAEKNAAKVTTRDADGKKTGETTTLTQKLTSEIQPLPATKVTTTLTETSVNDVKVSSTAFDASLGQGKRVEIATGVTNRSTEVSGASSLDTTRARVALRPMNNLTFTGLVVWNPEENNIVRQAMRQEVGVQTRVGALELGSAYAMTTLNGSASAVGDFAPQFGEVNVNVGLRLDKTLRLDGTYKDSLRYSGAGSSTQVPRYLRVYGLGLSRTLGPNFNWSLTGQVSDDRNRPVNLNTDYKAEAKMGLKF